MGEQKASCYIKLGTGLRYLIDAREGDPLDGKHILANLESVLTLIPMLGFESTANSGKFKQLQDLNQELIRANGVSPSLSAKDRARLEPLCRTIRQSLLTEGDRITLAALKHSAAAASPELTLPNKVTLNWLFQHVPVYMWVIFAGLLGTAYAAGETKHYINQLVASTSPKQADKEPSAGSEQVKPATKP